MATRKVNLSVYQLELLQKKYKKAAVFELISNKAIMRMLPISASTLYRLRTEMNIPYVKIGKQIFYVRDQILRYVLQQHGMLPADPGDE